MKTQTKANWIAMLSMAVFWLNPASAAIFNGIAVEDAGEETPVGSTQNINVGGDVVKAIKYYIPLDDDYIGTYGVGPAMCPGGAGTPGNLPGGAGTCSDNGNGTGYDNADALKMNIFFDLSGQPESADATLNFIFDDLDLTPENDPDGFLESISLSYWNFDDSSSSFDPIPVALTSVIKDIGDFPSPGIDLDLNYLPGDTNIITWEANLITLDLSLVALNALNASSQSEEGYWIQLGFGSDYYDHKHPWNTPEFLAASLELTPVPIPAAIWLFGTALLGFIGFSRRTTI